ncbi:dimethyl sulfoxide reductase anchor subunit family protein [Alkalilacustris brevis]|uniref:dimethyl sulfoxide reductase anchor subunit family protein n=1 Tax=Alkalilacustris brevis TaxID=2026338 RepID=UPI000E0DE785|nr:DmsC/YnfH family molybdoenzyme membrane anchor subunit [Alkalilacustris brevis]
MHPATSVILFSSLSGLGFGLMVWLGLGYPTVTGWSAFAFYFIAYALAVGGLMASAFHLANPRNAPKAFSQWRTSWLSREAWAAVIALLVVAGHAIGVIFFATRLPWLGALGAVLALATVLTTAMIYTQLRTVPRWNTPATPVLFVTLSLAGGALLAGQTRFALPLLLLAGAVQLLHWHLGDRRAANPASTRASATGLGHIGQVRLFEPPHTGTNYLMREMVHEIGRKHARRLRVLTILLMIVLPVILLALSFSHWLAAVAVIAHLAGAITSRWLFFAEAEHSVGLYYGKGK